MSAAQCKKRIKQSSWLIPKDILGAAEGWQAEECQVNEVGASNDQVCTPIHVHSTVLIVFIADGAYTSGTFLVQRMNYYVPQGC